MPHKESSEQRKSWKQVADVGAAAKPLSGCPFIHH